MTWKPEIGEEYWYIDESGGIDCIDEFTDSWTDNYRLYFGNCFKDEVAAGEALMQIDIEAGGMLRQEFKSQNRKCLE